MNLFASIIFAIFCITFINSANLKEPTISTICGGTLDEYSGGISYKPFEITDDYERCVWTIRARSANQYTFNFYNLGVSTPIVIAAFTLNQPVYQVTEIVANTDIVVNGSVIVVSFVDGANSIFKGFSLYYNVTGNYSSPVSENSIDTVVTGANATISHPQDLSQYSNNELSTFVFSPAYQVYKTLNLEYSQRGWDGITCKDSITIYDIIYRGIWKEVGRICGVDKEVSFNTNRILLLVFKTDAATVGNGFDIEYSFI